jgi:DNA primase
MDIIRLLVNYGDAEVVFHQKSEEGKEEEVVITTADYIIHTLENDEIKFENPAYQKIFNHYSEWVHKEMKIDVKRLFLNTDIEVVETVVSLSSTKYELSLNWKEKHNIYVSTEDMKLKFALEHSVLALQLKKIEINIQEIQEKLKGLEDEEEMVNLLTSQLTYIELKKMISDKLNRIILK